MVDTLHTTATARIIGAGGDFTSTKKLVDDARKLRSELEAVGRKDITWASPKRNVPGDKDVVCARGCKLGGSGTCPRGG